MLQEIRNIYLSGLGAVGGTYALTLSSWGPDRFKVIADPERIRRYAEGGISINGAPVAFRYVQPDAEAPPADLILVAVKQHQLGQAIHEMRRFVGEETIILSLLNGIDSEQVIGREFGMEKLLYSFVVGTDAVREGTQIHFTKVGTIVFGEPTNTVHSPKVVAVKTCFDRAGIPYRIPENMMRELWWKFMMNVGVNQTSAVMKANYGAYQKIEEARSVMVMACLEVVRISEQAGINLTPQDVDQYFQVIQKLSPESKTSMLQDIEACRKTEVEIFAGTVMELGRRYGIPTPVNDLLYGMIRTIERTYLEGCH